MTAAYPHLLMRNSRFTQIIVWAVVIGMVLAGIGGTLAIFFS